MEGVGNLEQWGETLIERVEEARDSEKGIHEGVGCVDAASVQTCCVTNGCSQDANMDIEVGHTVKFQA